MSVYTVHEPPAAGNATPDPDRFAFVRDGFSVWAFLLTPLWMLWHRLWLIFVAYVVLSAALDTAIVWLGMSRFAAAIVGFLISLLIGLEGGTLRRFTLSRRGWKNVGVVSGADREEAELRFFDAWLKRPHPQPDNRAQPTPMILDVLASSVTRPPQPPGVVGLFPEPGAPR